MSATAIQLDHRNDLLARLAQSRSVTDDLFRRVRAGAANFRTIFRRDETIWTESSRKYDKTEVAQMAGRTGFECVAQWVDEEWPFAENLFVAV